MREAGVSFVTLGVFSWSLARAAPRASTTFEWLDEIMDLLHANGIAVDLATATATPPPWLTSAYPEILPVDHDGHTLWPGSRQAWCPSSPLYREMALGLTDRLADRYHDHPALAMWHVSNEYACHNLPCYCDTCAVAFRRWLRAPLRHPRRAQRRLGHRLLEPALHGLGRHPPAAAHHDVQQPHPRARLPPLRLRHAARLLPCRARGHPAALPRRAGHDELHDAEPLPPARLPRLGPVPGRRQHRPLRRRRAGATRRPSCPSAATSPAASPAGGPWLLMEHSTSAVNWQPVNPAKAPGEHDPRLAGPRRPRRRHPRLLPVAPVPGGLGEVPLGAACRTPARTATGSARSCELGAHRGPARRARRLPGRRRGGRALGLRVGLGRARARACRRPRSTTRRPPTRCTGCCATAGSPATSCTPTPTCRAYRGGRRAHPLPRLRRAGGCRARGGRGAAPTCWSPTSPASATPTTTCGSVATRERSASCSASGSRSSSPCGSSESVALSDGGAGSQWSEDARVVDAEVVTTYAAGPLAGRPAVTRRAAGDGVAWYLGTLPDDDSLGALLDRVVAEAGVAPAAVPPAGVEVVRRRSTRRAAGCSCSTTPTSTARSPRPGTTWSPASTWARPSGSRRARAAVVQGGVSVLASQRRAAILALVEESGAVRVSDLVDQLGVSDMTVRRDIERLDSEGLLERVHGGALALVPRATRRAGLQREVARCMTAEKHAIAIAAAAPGRARRHDRHLGRARPPTSSPARSATSRT